MLHNCLEHLAEESRANQAWLTATCDICSAWFTRAYCARPGYGLNDDAEELPPEAFEWEKVS